MKCDSANRGHHPFAAEVRRLMLALPHDRLQLSLLHQAGFARQDG